MSNPEPLFWNPTPWRYEKETGTILDASGDSVLETAPDGHPYVEPDIGEAIVTAVNLHFGGSMELPDIEAVSAKAHEAWMQSKLDKGITTRKSETGEELMVPYDQLSEAAKDLDRNSVKAVYAAIEAVQL